MRYACRHFHFPEVRDIVLVNRTGIQFKVIKFAVAFSYICFKKVTKGTTISHGGS